MTLTYDTPTPTSWLTVVQYAEQAGKTDRTIKRWLADGELAGARQDERGRWLIPADAERDTSGELVTLTQRPMTRPMTSHPAEVSLDALPSFLTLDQAAQILGVSRHAIREHRDYFGVVPFGTNGSLVVPLATIKKIRGC